MRQTAGLCSDRPGPNSAVLSKVRRYVACEVRPTGFCLWCKMAAEEAINYKAVLLQNDSQSVIEPKCCFNTVKEFAQPFVTD